MQRRLPWIRTLNAKLGGVVLILFAFCVALIVGNTLLLTDMRGDSRKMNTFAHGATYDYKLLFNAEHLMSAAENAAARANSEAQLRETIAKMDARFHTLLYGDPARGIPAINEPTIRANTEQDATAWRSDRKPRLQHFLAASPVQRAALIGALRKSLIADAVRFTRAAHVEQEYLAARVDQVHALQFFFLGVATLILAFVVLLMRWVSARARSLATTADRIASGELALSATVTGNDELTLLGKAFNTMTANLRRVIKTEREAAQANEEHLWVISSLASVNDAMRGNPRVAELANKVIGSLCEVLGAQVGALYVGEDGGGVLRLRGRYALSDDDAPDVWRRGEGLVGQAAAEKRRIIVENIPDEGIRVRWGLGESAPRSLVVLPLLHEKEVHGVLEIGSLAELGAAQLDMLDRAAPSIGLAISAAAMRERLQQLLEESQAQAEELTAQQEELRAVNKRLAQQARALELQKENLQATETVLRQKAAQLERASHYKSEFLANMSHELRTPLNSSLILAKLLSDNRERNLTDEQVRYAESIYAAGNELLGLVNDILDLSKVEAGRIELNIEPVSVQRFVGDLQRRFEPIVADKGLKLQTHIEPGCAPQLHTDGQRLQQILGNLLSNAVKFTDTGSIRLEARSVDSQHIAFIVQDTGIGIAPEQQAVVFDAFRQADGTTHRKYGGTGLGLSICRELAQLLGGAIELESSPGHGSTFTVQLPLLAPVADGVVTPPAPVDEEPVPAPSPVGEAAADPTPAPTFVEDDRDALVDPKRVVLIVEDDAAFARIVRDLAHEQKFQCVIAPTADAALNLARHYDPVAIVLDIGLPDHSGLSVLDNLKRDPATRHIPIHVVSVLDYRRLAYEMGAVGYALKPVSRDDLVAAFHALEERLARDVKTVLVVEDNPTQRQAIIDLLRADNIRIEAVGTAADALEALGRATFDCVVVDLMLPDVSGFELLRQMSEDDKGPVPPVIVYTARSLSRNDAQQLRRYSRSIIIKGARSPERLLEEVTLFLHQVETDLPADKQRMLEVARGRESIFDGRRILLVEDDVRNVFALSSVLEPKGVVIEIARNGKEALARLQQGPPVDLVLMDVMMPEMDGLTATREIRKVSRWAALPIIALTARAMNDDRLQCLDAGANDYIAKPVAVDNLLSMLRVWMPR